MRRMKTKQIESTVTKSGNSGHIIVPKDWIGQGVIVKLKEDRK
jgi:putative transposon-encoded protein